jgi:hypothetical protein
VRLQVSAAGTPNDPAGIQNLVLKMAENLGGVGRLQPGHPIEHLLVGQLGHQAVI